MRLVSTGGLLINPLLLFPEVIQAKAAGDQVADARRHPFDPTRHPEFARRHPKRTREFEMQVICQSQMTIAIARKS